MPAREKGKKRGKNKGRKGRDRATERGRYCPGRGWREKDGEEERNGGCTKRKVETGGLFSCFLRKAVEDNWFLM